MAQFPCGEIRQNLGTAAHQDDHNSQIYDGIDTS